MSSCMLQLGVIPVYLFPSLLLGIILLQTVPSSGIGHHGPDNVNVKRLADNSDSDVKSKHFGYSTRLSPLSSYYDSNILSMDESFAKEPHFDGQARNAMPVCRKSTRKG